MGLLSIGADRKITVLATQADGIHFGFPDDLTIAADGTIWFTDGSARFERPLFFRGLLGLGPERLERLD